MTLPLSRPCRSLLCALALLASGCSSFHLPGKPDSVASKPVRSIAPPPPTVPTAHGQLTAGLDAYNSGDYPTAIRRFTVASDPGVVDKATQLEAIKYLAFSYCLTNQTALCRLQFERALRIDPNFDLAPGEKGHPLWGPVFDRAKKGKAG